MVHVQKGGHVRRGDRIAAVAQPIAKTADRIFHTKIATCGGCKQTQDDLNAGMSVVEALKRRFVKRRRPK
jgi:hypothetical protein